MGGYAQSFKHSKANSDNECKTWNSICIYAFPPWELIYTLPPPQTKVAALLRLWIGEGGGGGESPGDVNQKGLTSFVTKPRSNESVRRGRPDPDQHNIKAISAPCPSPILQTDFWFAFPTHGWNCSVRDHVITWGWSMDCLYTWTDLGTIAAGGYFLFWENY